MNSLIIGTAGHIDHGKSSLIKALNGFEGDTLALERQRGITMELSFSHLSGGEANIAFIDVPGHENLVKTMISGAFAFSVCLFVVDINEGLKAQSVEHLRILGLLGCKDIILVLSKCDLCEDAKEREGRILKDIEPFKMRILRTFRTSIKDEASIDSLKSYLFTLKARSSDERLLFRYYIDRVFTLKGIGTVVTGSLNEGRVSVDERIFCLDLGKDLLVKNVQIQGENVPSAAAFNRVALSLNCDYKLLKKGFLLSKKGFFRGFKEADAVVFGGDFKGKNSLLFCVGSRQVSAKMTILREFEGKFYVHFDFDKALFLSFDERFILLENSRFRGGGRILNPIIEPLKKEQKIKFLSLLERASEGLNLNENSSENSGGALNLNKNLGENDFQSKGEIQSKNSNKNSSETLNLNEIKGKNSSNVLNSNENSSNALNLNKNSSKFQNENSSQTLENAFLPVFEFLKATHKLGFGLLSSYQRFKLLHSEALSVAKSLKNAFVDEKELNVYDLNAGEKIKEFTRFLLAKNDYAMLSANLLSTKLGWASEAFCEFVLRQMPAELDFEGGIYFKKGMSFEKVQSKNHDELYFTLKKEGIKPTAPYNLYDFLELDRTQGDSLLKRLTKNGLVVRLAHNLFIEKSALAGLEKACLKLLETQALDIRAMKEHFGLSRKYAIAYLEWLDKHEKITKVGEKRVLKASV